ncbi:MAG: O-antigen ligase family protein [Candidatus Izemoplasmatales bacterium]
MSLIKKFPYSFLYLFLLSGATLYLWQNHLERFGIPAILALMFLFFLFSKNTVMTIPLLFNAMFMVSTLPTNFAEVPTYLYFVPGVLIVGMTLHIFIYKVKLFHGKMLLGIGLMVLAMLLSSINVVKLDIYYYFYASVGILYALFYVFYRNTIEGDYTDYLIKMLFVLGLLISAQIVLYYLGVDDVRYALEHKIFNLGWGISNYVATYLIIFSVIPFYYAKKAPTGLLYFLIGFMEIGLIPFTGSRGGMVAFVALFPILLFILFFKSKKKWLHFLSLSLVFILFVSIVFINWDFVKSVFFRFESIMFDDTGRFDIYVDAIHTFLEFPLFGGGLFARDATRDFNMFHNTILHTGATLGSIGLISLLIQLWQQFRITVGKFTNEGLFLAAALLGAHIHGMIDNVYYMPQFMIMMLVIVAIREKAEVHHQLIKDYQ